MAKNEASIAAIRIQKSGTVNPQRLVRDFRKIMGEIATDPSPIRATFFCPLIAAGHASFSESSPPKCWVA